MRSPSASSPADRVDQLLDLGPLRRLRQPLRPPRRERGVGDAGRAEREAEEGADGGELARDRRRCEPVAGAPELRRVVDEDAHVDVVDTEPASGRASPRSRAGRTRTRAASTRRAPVRRGTGRSPLKSSSRRVPAGVWRSCHTAPASGSKGDGKTAEHTEVAALRCCRGRRADGDVGRAGRSLRLRRRRGQVRGRRRRRVLLGPQGRRRHREQDHDPLGSEAPRDDPREVLPRRLPAGGRGEGRPHRLPRLSRPPDGAVRTGRRRGLRGLPDPARDRVPAGAGVRRRQRAEPAALPAPAVLARRQGARGGDVRRRCWPAPTTR